MSIEALSWAFDTDCPSPASKLLLIAFANSADAYGVTWVGRAALAALCGCRLATVTANAQRLEKVGLIRRLERERANGSRTSDFTVLGPLQFDRSPMLDAPREALRRDYPLEVYECARENYDEEWTPLLREARQAKMGPRTGGGTPSVRPGVRLARGPDPSVEPSVEAEELTLLPTDDRASRFFDAHVSRVLPITNKRPARTAQALAAGRRIITLANGDSRQILEKLDWALRDRFYADKVLTLPGFERWWPRVSAAYAAERNGGNGNGRSEAPPPSRVSYEGERVEVTR